MFLIVVWSFAICTRFGFLLLSLCWSCVSQEKVSKVREVKELAVSNLQQAIEDEKKEQWRAEGRQNLFDAKRVTILPLQPRGSWRFYLVVF